MAAFQYVLAYVFFALLSYKLQANSIFPVEFNSLNALPRTETSIKSNRNVQGLHPLYEQGAKHFKKIFGYKICIRFSKLLPP